MVALRLLIATWLATTAVAASSVSQAALQLEEKSGKAPALLGIEMQLRAAGSLHERRPELARPFLLRSVEQLGKGEGWALDGDSRKILAALAPESMEALSPRLAAPAERTPAPPEAAATIKRMRTLRGLSTDGERAKLVSELAAEIRAFPAGTAKLGLAEALANYSTEGDLGREALAAVVATLGQAMQQSPAGIDTYLELARLVRYERVPAPFSEPALDAATALLALRECLYQEVDFTLTGLDGKRYSLASLRGRVVLLNFWATWCPPCRREMPDMEKLYARFRKKGFTVLAVSDEERPKVAQFIEKQNYRFPVLLDPDRKVHAAFDAEGIPQSFLFDRKGKLVAQAIDMRTERQFLEMLKSAGIE